MLNKTHTLESEIEPKPSVRKALEVETASEDLLDEILYDIDNQLEFEINRIRKKRCIQHDSMGIRSNRRYRQNVRADESGCKSSTKRLASSHPSTYHKTREGA